MPFVECHRCLGKVVFVRLVSRTMVCVAAMTAVGVHAQSNNFDLQYKFTVTAPAQTSLSDNATYWERFSYEFEPCATEVFSDDFNPFNTLNRNADWASSTASHDLSKSVWYTMRESAVQLPLMVWLDQHQSFLGHLLGNSVDDVGEESVSPLNPYYRPAEVHWWNEMSQRGDMQYGLRPFGTSPYAFLTMAFHQAGHVVLLAHLRYHYDNFADHHFECALSAPLAHGVSLDMGTEYQFGLHDQQKKVVVKLIKQIGTVGAVDLGVELEDHPTLFAGITFPM
jgi:hypothetical protein